MLQKIWKKCVNCETVSYIICGFLTTAVDFVVYGVLREAIVFRNYNLHPGYLVKELGAFVAARIVSGVVTWLLMVAMVKFGGDRGLAFEMFCKFVSSFANVVLNYIFSKLFVFKNKPVKGDSDGT